MEYLDFKKVEAILKNRFVDDSITNLSALPLPNTLQNLTTIAKHIKDAINLQKKIVVVGDYDVDGVVSCAILHEFFKKIPYGLEIVIPNRFSDGYGLSKQLIQRLDCDVIITVDNGINAIEAAEFCKENGIMLLITDHHTPQGNLPDALLCNPKLSPNFPEPEICGACVAWYLCAALKAELGLELQMVKFLDFLALAIVSDVMPLRGVNYVLLKKGLEMLEQSNKTPFLYLKECFSKHNIDAQLISYYIAPLLNCAGRMESAMLSFKFLITNEIEDSKRILEQLMILNQSRKDMQNAMYEEAKAEFLAQDNAEDLPFILVWNPNWHEGIIGIIAARLCDDFDKPCIVLSLKDGILKGSMRSNKVDCMEVLESLKSHLVAFGGHFGAAGLSLKKESLEPFRKDLLAFRAQNIKEESKMQGVLGRLPLEEADFRLFNLIQKFAPFGHGNMIPKFYTKAQIVSVRYFGAGHSSIYLKEGQQTRNALVFFKDLQEYKGAQISCIYTLGWDKYKNDILLNLEDFKIL